MANATPAPVDPKNAAPPAAAPDDPSKTAPAAAEGAAPPAVLPSDAASGGGAAQSTAREIAMRNREGKRWRDEKRRADEERKSFTARFDKLEAEIKAEREEKAKLHETLAGYRKDPLTMAEKDVGLKADDAIRANIDRNAPERLIADQNERIEALQKELRDAKKEYEGKANEARESAIRRGEAAALQNFVTAVTNEANVTKYPYLNAEHTPAEIRLLAQQVHEWAKSNSHSYKFDQVAAFLDKQAKTAYETKKAARERLLSPPGQPGAPATAAGIPSAPDPGKGHRATSGPASRANAGANGSNGKRRMTREEEEAHDVAILRAASEKDRKARAS